MKTLLTNAGKALVPLGLLLLATPAARAQDIPIPDYTIQNQGRIGTLITQGVIDRAQGKSARPAKGIVVGRPGSRPPTTAGATSVPVALGRTANLTYTPTAALRQETVRRYVAKLQPINPAAAQAVTNLFGPGKGDYGQVYQTLAHRSGLAENDVADALAVFTVVGYMVVNNTPSAALSPAMLRGVRTQMAQVLTTNETFATPGAAGRFGEQTKLHAVIMQGGWQAAIQQHTLPAYQRTTDALFSQQFGLHFFKLGLTEQGFVHK